MSIVLYALGIIVNGIIGSIPDLAVNIAASVVYDSAKKIYDTITVQKGRDRNLNMLHPVIETALINSFYNAIILSLTKTRDYYRTTSNRIYKKEILQISARIKDLSKLLKAQSSSSGYSLILDSFCEVMVNSTADNASRLIIVAKNNLIGLPEKAQSDLENNFIGIFLILFKEKFSSDDILKSLLTFDMLKSNLTLSIDTNKKIDTLICSNINIENELKSISAIASNLPTNGDFVEVRTMLSGIQNTLMQLSQSDDYSSSSSFLVERSYLDIVYNRYKYVELPSFDGTKKRTPIKDIYSPLELINRIAVTVDSEGKVIKMPISEIDEYTASNSEKNPFIIERMSIYDVLPRHQNAFIVGSNGTGKSITAQHILCCLACYQSNEADYWSEQRVKFGLNDREEIFIPIYISLLDYYQYDHYGRGASGLLSYLENIFSLQKNFAAYLNQKLLKGKAIIVIEDCNFRNISSSAVLSDLSDFVSNYSRCRYLIFRDCSNDNHYDQYSIFDDIPKFELARLSPRTMREMADKYGVVLSTFYDVSNFSFECFSEKIKKIGLNALLEKPYWFVILLMMNYAFNELPNNTYNIYIKIADNMLNRLFYLLDNFSEVDKQNIASTFELLSLKLFSEMADSAIVSTNDIQKIFENNLTPDKASMLMKIIKTNNCELLINNMNDTISFVHKPLISAMVARYFKHNIASISMLIDNTIKSPNIWMESLELLFDDKNYDLLAFVLFIIQSTPKCKDVCGKISLGILSKVDVRSFIVRPERLSLVKSALQVGNELIASGKLSLPDRISVSEDLSLISASNDFKIDVNSYFTLIPSGIVTLGNDKLTLGEPYEYNINYDYYAAKFPVTNFEYQQFLFENSEYPIPVDEIDIWDLTTRSVDKRFLNHPVVGVNFYDALKYCQWLNKKLELPSGYKVWLPSDPEWMKMYRGGKLINGKINMISDRVYPWGNEWIEGYANLSKLKNPIFATTPVGIFVEGISVYGCYDTCGNVLEWTTTSWGGFNHENPEYTHPYSSSDGREDLKLPGLRITRGGSFLFSEGDAKCSCRLEPESKFPDTGFRVFLVPDEKNTEI